MITFIIFYFSGMILTWIIGILAIKYHKELVTNRYDLGNAVEMIIGLSLLSWIMVLTTIVLYIVYYLKQFICNVFGDWILKGKEDF